MLDIKSIRERNERRKKDPAINYQYGCSGRHRGSCGEGLHHHHDERCDPPVTVDIDMLLIEIELLTNR